MPVGFTPDILIATAMHDNAVIIWLLTIKG